MTSIDLTIPKFLRAKKGEDRMALWNTPDVVAWRKKMLEQAPEKAFIPETCKTSDEFEKEHKAKRKARTANRIAKMKEKLAIKEACRIPEEFRIWHQQTGKYIDGRPAYRKRYLKALDEVRVVRGLPPLTEEEREKAAIRGLGSYNPNAGSPKRSKKMSTAKRGAPKGEGYKGHRPGSNIEKLHQRFDEKGEDAARKLGEKLGLAPATINIQLSHYRNEGGKKAKAKKVKGRKATKKAA